MADVERRACSGRQPSVTADAGGGDVTRRSIRRTSSVDASPAAALDGARFAVEAKSIGTFRAGGLQPYTALVIPLLSEDRFHTRASLTLGLDGLLP
jgi:hypothetical protein